jgi:F0F1-type ATP synthase membrane subunit a
METVIFAEATNWFIEFLIAFRDQFIESIGISDIGEEISLAILQQKLSMQVGPVNFLLTDAVIVTWVSVGIAIVLLIWLAAKRERLPKGRQLVVESLVSMLLNLCKTNGMNQKQAEEVAPFVGTVGVFLVACNLASAFMSFLRAFVLSGCADSGIHSSNPCPRCFRSRFLIT